MLRNYTPKQRGPDFTLVTMQLTASDAPMPALFAFLFQAPKLGKDYPAAPQSALSHFVIMVFIVLLGLGFVWAMTLIIRTLIGKPED